MEDDPFSKHTIIAKEANSQATKTKTTTLAKMDFENVMLDPCPTDVQFNIEDFLPNNNSWIVDNEAFTVPDLQLLQTQPDYSAEEVLNEIIPPEDDWLINGSSDLLDQSFLEKYIDLAALDSCINSCPATAPVQDTMPNVLDNLLISTGQDPLNNELSVEDGYYQTITPSPSNESLVDIETVSETDSVALVPDITDEICLLSPDENNVESSMLAIDQNDLLLTIDPSVLSLLDNFEQYLPVENEVTLNPKKRPLSSNDNSSNPKKMKVSTSSCSSSDDLPVLHDKTVERRIKNNAASRVCRASRKARHQDLFDSEKELISENKELTCKVEELSGMVEFLRNYLVEKLSEKNKST